MFRVCHAQQAMSGGINKSTVLSMTTTAVRLLFSPLATRHLHQHRSQLRSSKLASQICQRAESWILSQCVDKPWGPMELNSFSQAETTHYDTQSGIRVAHLFQDRSPIRRRYGGGGGGGEKEVHIFTQRQRGKRRREKIQTVTEF